MKLQALTLNSIVGLFNDKKDETSKNWWNKLIYFHQNEHSLKMAIPVIIDGLYRRPHQAIMNSTVTVKKLAEFFENKKGLINIAKHKYPNSYQAGLDLAKELEINIQESLDSFIGDPRNECIKYINTLNEGKPKISPQLSLATYILICMNTSDITKSMPLVEEFDESYINKHLAGIFGFLQYIVKSPLAKY